MGLGEANLQWKDKAAPSPRFALPRPGCTACPFSSHTEAAPRACALPVRSCLSESPVVALSLVVATLTLVAVCRWVCAAQHASEM